MGKIVYESIAFQAPAPISESEYLEQKENLGINRNQKLYKNKVEFFKQHRISLIIIGTCLPIGILTDYYSFKPDWIGIVIIGTAFIVGIKFLLSFSSYFGYITELNKFNRRLNKAIIKSKNFNDFYKTFYLDKRYYEEV